MRKFKFIGTEQDSRAYGYQTPEKGMIYTEDSLIGLAQLREWMEYSFFDSEFQEVFEEEQVQLTETEKIVLIDFLNDHFEEFWHFVGSSKTTDYNYWEILKEQTERYTVNEIVSSKDIVSNIIDKIERL